MPLMLAVVDQLCPCRLIISARPAEALSQDRISSQSSSTGRPEGFLVKKYFADNGALIGVNVRGALPKLKNSVRSPIAARIGERQRALLRDPEVPLDEPDYAPEVLSPIVNIAVGV